MKFKILCVINSKRLKKVEGQPKKVLTESVKDVTVFCLNNFNL